MPHVATETVRDMLLTVHSSQARCLAQGFKVAPVSASFLLDLLPIMSTPMAPYQCIPPDAGVK